MIKDQRVDISLITFLILLSLYSFEPLLNVFFVGTDFFVSALTFSLLLMVVTLVFFQLFFDAKIKIPILLFFIFVIYVLFAGFINDIELLKSLKVVMFEGKFIIIGFLFIFLPKTDLSKASKFIFILFSFQLLFGICQMIDDLGLKSFIVNSAFSEADQYYRDNVLVSGVFGSFLSKNVFGYFSLFCFIVFFYYPVFLSTKLNKIVFIMCFIAVVISQSRTALLYFILFNYYKSSLSIKLGLKGAGLIFLLSLALFSFDSLPKSVSELMDGNYYKNIVNVGRGAYLLASLNSFVESPFIGVGAGNWGLGLAFSAEFTHNEIISKYGYNIPLGVFQDNNWLSILTQFGSIGFALFLLFLFYFRKYYITEKYNISCKCSDTLLLALIFNCLFLAGFTVGVLVLILQYFALSKSE